MPFYEYYCDKCQHAFDEILTVSKRNEPTKQPCPECGAMEVCKGVSETTMGVDATLTPDKVTGGDWSRLMEKVKKTAPKRMHDNLDKSSGMSGRQYGPR